MREEGIDNKQLIVAIQELEKEKGIKKDYLLDSIESALLTAYKRNYNSQAVSYTHLTLPTKA